MRKLFNVIFNRITVTGILILIQLMWLLAAFTKFARYSPWISAALTLMSVLMVLLIVSKDDNQMCIRDRVKRLDLPHVAGQLRALEQYSLETERQYPWMPSAYGKNH